MLVKIIRVFKQCDDPGDIWVHCKYEINGSASFAVRNFSCYAQCKQWISGFSQNKSAGLRAINSLPKLLQAGYLKRPSASGSNF